MTKDFLLRLTEEHYGTGAFPVYGRLLEEQRLVRGGPLLPMWHCAAALRRAFGGENVLVLGCTNDSLLACLLGATSVNPLPPHYRCTNCHYTTFGRDRYEDGWDMPDAVCPVCGGSMEGDGHRLSSRSLAMRLPDISLRVPDEMRQLVTDFIPDYWQRMDDVIAFREDVYDLIRRHTPPKARAENGIPWQIMEAVRKGKYARYGMPEELKRYLSCTLRLPKYYISALKRIEYLPKKGDCVARWMME